MIAPPAAARYAQPQAALCSLKSLIACTWLPSVSGWITANHTRIATSSIGSAAPMRSTRASPRAPGRVDARFDVSPRDI